MKLIEFIKNNDRWEELLQKYPYNLHIKRDDNFIIFMYDLLNSEFSLQIVRESRGIIIDNDYNVVCRGFDKFFNYGESNAAIINWGTAQVQEKIDGSIIKLWNYKGEWKLSTNNCIDAKKAITNYSSTITFGDLFTEALAKTIDIFKYDKFKYDQLNPEYTYIFELVSPYNRVVIPYQEIKIYHIGTRHNKTGKEINIDIEIEKPKMYNLKSLNDCLKKTRQMPYDQEGYVVVDGDFNRIKIKSPAYVAIHHLKAGYSENVLLTIIRTGEGKEFLNYFPEYKKDYDEMNIYYQKIIDILCKEFDYMSTIEFKDKKDFAINFAKNSYIPSIFFALYDRKINNINEGLNILSNKFILNKINKLKGEK